MFDDPIAKLKEKILDELISDLDNGEGKDFGEKLKPKAAISITAIKPKEPGEEMPADPLEAMAGGGADPDCDDDEEDLKALLKHYMGQ